jgi:hypothetical protein
MARSLLLFVAFTAGLCAHAQLVEKGRINGVDVAYRWRHPTGKPSELLIRLENTEAHDQRVALHVDLIYQGLTVEIFEADTCIRAGAILNGRVNGIFFRPQRLTPEQLRSDDVQVDLTNTTVERGECP